MSLIAACQTITLITTYTTAIVTIATPITISQTVKEETISTEWISHGLCYARNVSQFVVVVKSHLNDLRHTFLNP